MNSSALDKENDNEHNKLDSLKGIAILLVIAGHVLMLIDSPSNMFWKNIIYSFHMPLFMFLGGLILYGRVGQDKLRWIVGKWFHFMIPAIAFALIYWTWSPSLLNLSLISGLSLEFPSMNGFLQYMYVNIYTGMTPTPVWFLWSLFCLYLLTLIVEKYKRWWVPVVIVVVLNLIPFDSFGLVSVKWYSLFFFGGYLVSKYRYVLSGWMKILSVAGFLLLVFVMITNMIDTNEVWLLWAHKFFIAIFGIGFVFTISDWIQSKLLIYLGSASMGIFLIHTLFNRITDNVAINFFFAMFISVAVYELLLRAPVLNFVLLGDRRTTDSLANRLISNFKIENGRIHFRRAEKI